MSLLEHQKLKQDPGDGYFSLSWLLQVLDLGSFQNSHFEIKKKKIQQEIYLEFFQDYEVDFVCLAILNWSNPATSEMLCQRQSSFFPGERGAESEWSPWGNGDGLIWGWPTSSPAWQAAKHTGTCCVLPLIAGSEGKDWCAMASLRISWPLWVMAISFRGLLKGKMHQFHADSGEKINFTTLLPKRHKTHQSWKTEPYHCYTGDALRRGSLFRLEMTPKLTGHELQPLQGIEPGKQTNLAIFKTSPSSYLLRYVFTSLPFSHISRESPHPT